MVTDPGPRWRARLTAVVTAVALSLLGASAAPVLVSVSEEQQGAQLLRSFEAGKQSCQQLSRDQLELIGEYVMSRMVGSTAAHEAMNVQMRSMMGESGEARAHVFMGQRFTGCTRGQPPAAFGSMMGMMGAYGSNAGNGVMGGGGSGNVAGRGMMGGSGSAHGDGGWSGADTVMVVLMGVLLAAVLAALAAWRPWRQPRGGTPLDVLRKRYARGEIDADEYERRRQALGEPT